MPTRATTAPSPQLLTPKDHTLILINFQSQMAFATKSIDAIMLRNNAALIWRAAVGFGASTILTDRCSPRLATRFPDNVRSTARR